jgi:hypothetical protein
MLREKWLNTSDLRRAFEYANATGKGFSRILFLCPKGSGKTTALFEIFLQTPDSVFLTPYGSHLNHLRQRADRIEYGRGSNLKPMYDILPFTNTSPLGRGHRPISCVFIDDLDRCIHSFIASYQHLVSNITSTNSSRRGIMATMTPREDRNINYQGFFDYIKRPFSPDQDSSIDKKDFYRTDHFEGDLFKV